MGTLMQLLLEALRANVGYRNDDLGPVERQLSDEMSGFILENVHVATMPNIDFEEEEELPNPLRQLVHNLERPRRGTSDPQNIHKILDHIVKLEKKVEVLERCIPQKKMQQRLWLGASKTMDAGHSYDDSDYDPEGEDEVGTPKSSKSKSSHGRPSVATQPIRLEKEERSCFARLLFSRCWTGKDNGAGWKVKRRCPTGEKDNLSCPCGQIGPCHRVKGHACPIDKMKSTAPDKKNTKASSASTRGSSRKTADKKNQKKHGSSNQKVAKPTNGKPLYEKLFPCCFKEHMHSECCCRCKDNPPLPVHRKSKGEIKKSGRKPPSEHDSPSEDDTGDAEGSGYYDDQSEYQAFNVRSISELSPKNHEKINHLSRKQATGDMRINSTRKESRTTSPLNAKKEVESNSHRLETDNELTNKSAKSTTSFQIVLHPDISNHQIVEPEVVSHQILKTLSTIHGPVKVEQKIVVQGVENSVIIVTHGEACQCNLCNMLKGKMHPRELVEGLSPQIVKISTDNGCNTLINHSDGCKCDLCRVLDPTVTKNMEHGTPRFENESLVMAACSKSNINDNSEKSTPDQHSSDNQATPTAPQAALDKHDNGTIRTHSLMKKSKCKINNGKKKTTKCRCTKCGQRRRVEKLKLRLKKEMGTEEYNKILREVNRCNDGNDPKSSKQMRTSVQSDSDDTGFVEPKRTKKSVSFSDDPDPLHQEEPRAHIGSNERNRKRCKLCELVDVNAKQPKGWGIRRDKDTTKSLHIENHNSTVYSMNESSHELPCECQLKRPKSSENGMYRSKSEQQKCFPPGHIPKNSREQQVEQKMKAQVTEEFSYFEVDKGRNEILHGSSCSGRCSRESPREELNGHSAILLQEGAFPQNFVNWVPQSRSNMATAHSSESYYVPDHEEFPIGNMEYDESTPSSGRNTGSGRGLVQRVQIPIWFRMLPDRNTR